MQRVTEESQRAPGGIVTLIVAALRAMQPKPPISFALFVSSAAAVLGSTLIYDSRASAPFNSTASWGGAPAFPVGYFARAGSSLPSCTRGTARFLTVPAWPGSAAGEVVRELTLRVGGPPGSSSAFACGVRLTLLEWDDLDVAAAPGAAVGFVLSALLVASSATPQEVTISIPPANAWALLPNRHYALSVDGDGGCTGSVPAQPFFDVGLVGAPAPVAPTLWTAVGQAGVYCPGGVQPFTADPAIPGATWALSLSIRDTLVLRGAEGDAKYPGVITSGLPFSLPRQVMQLIWEAAPIPLEIVSVSLSLYGSGLTYALAYNATVLFQLCYLDGSNSCVGSAGLPTTTASATATIPGSGSAPAAVAFELTGLSICTNCESYRAALQFHIVSIVAADGTAPLNNAASLLSCANGVVNPEQDADLTGVRFLANTYSSDGVNFFPDFPAGSGPPVPFPCMVVRVVPADANRVFSSSISASPSATPNATVSSTSSATPSVTPSATPSATVSAAVSASSGPTSTGTGTGTLSTSPTATPSFASSARATSCTTTTGATTGASIGVTATHLPPAGAAATTTELSPVAVAGVVIAVLFALAVCAFASFRAGLGGALAPGKSVWGKSRALNTRGGGVLAAAARGGSLAVTTPPANPASSTWVMTRVSEFRCEGARV